MYKKPCENSALSILPPVFYRLSTQISDMNFTSVIFCLTAIMWLLCGRCESAPKLVSNVHRRLRNRPLFHGYAIEDLISEDDDNLELNKRQQFDDYGHMRFGKREQFDDYGHMRFGRNHE